MGMAPVPDANRAPVENAWQIVNGAAAGRSTSQNLQLFTLGDVAEVAQRSEHGRPPNMEDR
jgi:hypothetical protein